MGLSQLPSIHLPSGLNLCTVKYEAGGESLATAKYPSQLKLIEGGLLTEQASGSRFGDMRALTQVCEHVSAHTHPP